MIVHNLLSALLLETHAVHTKIYPRYRSKNHITFARNDFSKWLEPHEGDSTDVVLLGHSMGGLLSAEVALMPPEVPPPPLKHRILGTINFDVPFLGMHPGVVKSGLSSIFKPAGESPGDHWSDEQQQSSSSSSPPQGQGKAAAPPSRTDTLFAPGKQDPNFNPAFNNDVILPVRKGWRNAWHFINKHSDDLYKSTKKLVSSHLEFGGAMANYSELKTRYARIRALEEQDGRVRKTVVEGGVPPRVRFVNYYTASTGRPKKPSSPHRRLSPSPHGSRPSSRVSESRQSLDDRDTDAKQSRTIHESSSEQGLEDISDKQWNDAMESLSIDKPPQADKEGIESKPSSSDSHALPPLPSSPPPLGDLSYIQDKDTRKLVEKEHERAVRLYEKALKDRAKLDDKRKRKEEKTAERASHEKSKGKRHVAQKPESEMSHSEKEELRLHKEKLRMEAEGRRLRGEPEPEPDPEPEADAEPEHERSPASSLQATPAPEGTPESQLRSPSIAPSTAASMTTQDTNILTRSEKAESKAPKKDRKFCVLPPKDSNGERDPCWVRVFMENVDEVGAHCGLFFVDERYERLVGDVAERIESWIREQSG